SLATNFPPEVTNQSAAVQTVTVGDPVTFTVGVKGDNPLFFQWFFQASGTTTGGPILNATNPVLTIASVQLTNQGVYQLDITNRFGSTQSGLFSLFVNPTDTNAPGPPGAPGGP